MQGLPSAPLASPPTQPDGGPGMPPSGPGLGTMPLPAPQPRAPISTPPPIQPPADPTSPMTDSDHLPQPRPVEDIQNIFDRRGAMLALAVNEQGQRLAAAMAQPPTNAVKLSPEQLADFWRFSPVAADEATANSRFWQIHDQVLQQTGDPAQAEQQAMQQVFPYRAALIGQGAASIERQVETAQSIRQQVDGSVAPPDKPTAMLHHTLNRGIAGY